MIAKQEAIPVEKHTPGPWIAHGAYYQHGVKGDVFAKDAQDVFDATPICRVVQPVSHRQAKRNTAPPDALRAIGQRKEQAPVIEANARLIAASPELLSALRWLRAFWVPGSNHDTQEVQDALATADAAIAKATQP